MGSGQQFPVSPTMRDETFDYVLHLVDLDANKMMAAAGRRECAILFGPEWRALVSAEPIDPTVIMTKLRAALEDAEAFVSRMPTDRRDVRPLRQKTGQR